MRPVIDGYSIELETVAEDAIPGMTTYRLYVTMVNPTDVLSSVVGENGLETYINTSTSFYQDPFGGALGRTDNQPDSVRHPAGPRVRQLRDHRTDRTPVRR